jgi:hypothetical protein
MNPSLLEYSSWLSSLVCSSLRTTLVPIDGGWGRAWSGSAAESSSSCSVACPLTVLSYAAASAAIAVASILSTRFVAFAAALFAGVRVFLAAFSGVVFFPACSQRIPRPCSCRGRIRLIAPQNLLLTHQLSGFLGLPTGLHHPRHARSAVIAWAPALQRSAVIACSADLAWRNAFSWHLHYVAILLLPAGRGSHAYWRAPIGCWTSGAHIVAPPDSAERLRYSPSREILDLPTGWIRRGLGFLSCTGTATSLFAGFVQLFGSSHLAQPVTFFSRALFGFSFLLRKLLFKRFFSFPLFSGPHSGKYFWCAREHFSQSKSKGDY